MNSLILLTKQYAQQHRKYHTLEHIAYMFTTAKERGIMLNYAQQLAIWWHDAVYNVDSATNEEDSASLMWNNQGCVRSDILRDATTMIHDTKAHIPSNEASAIVSDLDMFILADSRNYDRYKIQVREEFSHVPIDTYCIRRKEFLERTITTEIFYSPEFIKHRENAVALMTEEIQTLDSVITRNAPKVA